MLNVRTVAVQKPGQTIDLKFNGELREHQKPTVEKYVKHAHKKEEAY